MTNLETMFTHPLFDEQCSVTAQLADYFNQQLSPFDMRLTEQHVAQCTHCQQQLTALSQLYAASDRGTVPEPQQTPTPLRRLVAWLTVATNRLELSNPRSSSIASRHTTLSNEPITLEVQDNCGWILLRYENDGITGSILPCPSGTVTMQLWGDAPFPIATAHCDAMGNFRFNAISATTYRLVIRADDVEIRVEQLEVAPL